MHIIKDCSRGIIFQLPQNDIYRIVGTGKHSYYYMPYKSRNYQQLYGAETVKLLHLFFNAKDRLHSY